jgi:apocytochrome f
MCLKKLFRLRIVCILSLNFIKTKSTLAYPIFAQQNYKNPRESNGRIVCANCHLAQKPVELDVPQAVLPDTVFEATVRVPYDLQVKQVLGNGKLGELNVGAVLILPYGFRLAPPEIIPAKLKERVGKLYFQPYSREQQNILVVGPLPGNKYQEFVVPLVSPNPKSEKGVNYLKYPIYLGGNRGRGQVYPDGSKSNNTVYTSSASGTVTEILPVEKKGGFQITLTTEGGTLVKENVPPGPELLVNIGQTVRPDSPLTKNPNIGGFGQDEGEIVLQDPVRIQGLGVFFVVTLLTQISLVLKKKQFEKVQLAEINFLIICLTFLKNCKYYI